MIRRWWSVLEEEWPFYRLMMMVLGILAVLGSSILVIEKDASAGRLESYEVHRVQPVYSGDYSSAALGQSFPNPGPGLAESVLQDGQDDPAWTGEQVEELNGVLVTPTP